MFAFLQVYLVFYLLILPYYSILNNGDIVNNLLITVEMRVYVLFVLLKKDSICNWDLQ